MTRMAQVTGLPLFPNLLAPLPHAPGKTQPRVSLDQSSWIPLLKLNIVSCRPLHYLLINFYLFTYV